MNASQLEDLGFLMTPQQQSRVADRSAKTAPKRRTDAPPRCLPSQSAGASSSRTRPAHGHSSKLSPIVLVPRLKEVIQARTAETAAELCSPPCERCLQKDFVCYWPLTYKAFACVKCNRAKMICSKSTNPPRAKDGKGKGKAAPADGPPLFIFDAKTVRSAQEVIAGHSAALMKITAAIEKEKADYDESMNTLEVSLEKLWATIEEQAKLGQ